MSKKRKIILGGALLCFAFIAFTVIRAMYEGQPVYFDTVVRNTIISWRNSILNPILIGITYLGNSQTIIMFCVVLLLFKRTRAEYGIPLSITSACSATIQTVIKGIVERPRPPVENFLISQGGFSFPSGHSCTGIVFYGLLAYLLFHTDVDNYVYKIMSRGCIVLFLMIGCSRIYVGVHYPTDVLGGWALGTVILMVALCIIDKIREIQKDKNVEIKVGM